MSTILSVHVDKSETEISGDASNYNNTDLLTASVEVGGTDVTWFVHGATQAEHLAEALIEAAHALRAAYYAQDDVDGVPV